MSNADIEELKRLTDRLVEEKNDVETTLFTLLGAIPMSVLLTRKRNVVWANSFSTHVFGWSKEEMVGKNTRFLYATQEDYDRVGENIYRVPEGFSDIFVKFRKKNGDIFNGFIRAIHISPNCEEVLVLILGLYDFRNRCDDLISLTNTGVIYAPPA